MIFELFFLYQFMSCGSRAQINVDTVESNYAR